MATGLRASALGAFRRVLRAREIAFRGDQTALDKARTRIRNEFKKNSKLQEENAIAKAIAVASDVEKLLQHNVLQAQRKSDDTFALNFTEHTHFNDNVPSKQKPNTSSSK